MTDKIDWTKLPDKSDLTRGRIDGPGQVGSAPDPSDTTESPGFWIEPSMCAAAYVCAPRGCELGSKQAREAAAQLIALADAWDADSVPDEARAARGACVVVTGKHADGRLAGARYTLPQKLEHLRATLDAAEATLRTLDVTDDMRVRFEPAALDEQS